MGLKLPELSETQIIEPELRSGRMTRSILNRSFILKEICEVHSPHTPALSSPVQRQIFSTNTILVATQQFLRIWDSSLALSLGIMSTSLLSLSIRLYAYVYVYLDLLAFFGVMFVWSEMRLFFWCVQVWGIRSELELTVFT